MYIIMFYRLDSPQIKGGVMYIMITFVYELPHELTKDLKMCGIFSS